ncbi:uncharacterized protein PpBr36_06668 [Pyricularia pennisetigena]|uniref:uncharacterized protein n=1 Tax=Pyricularia pennisetigena TaxID=1578925 RepID=UPI0011516CEF|nr:uncharacterized protein PpBr36_06668 [Pyricularia pennisetigena]TLS23734.1 hypothetical protein PpBr36_06668 [Pyricularia pennisetigena]
MNDNTVAPGSPQLGAPKLGDFSKLSSAWATLLGSGKSSSDYLQPSEKPTQQCQQKEEIPEIREKQDESCNNDPGSASNGDVSPVAFIPRDFLANFDFSKLDASSFTPPKQQQKAVSFSPCREEIDSTTSSPLSDASLGCFSLSSADEDHSTAPSSPQLDRPIQQELEEISILSHEPTTPKPSKKQKGRKNTRQRQAVTGPFKIPPHLRKSYAEELVKAERFLAENECFIEPLQRLNYSTVHTGQSKYSRGFAGEKKAPWFCPIPFPPLSRQNFDWSDFWESPHPLLSTDTGSINPVYISTNDAKCRLILGRLGIEFTRDALLGAPNDDTNKGVHIFVDMSNIVIGFQDQLKRLRGININTRLAEPPFFFQGLALVLERGRAVAKRVVAGSTSNPHEPLTWPLYLNEARSLGYEMNILHRVIKPLTQRYPARGPKQLRNTSDFWASSALNSSEDELEAQIQLEYSVGLRKKGEQAVDEILHLKMCESIIDSEPSTMVLATGDGAAAEFSAGFVAQAERALAKGWHIELVTWKGNISSAWQRLFDAKKWQNQLRLIHLDWYAEELLAGIRES